MIVLRRYNQHRRDLDIDMECESCGQQETYNSAYDDRNFWDNVIPNRECKNCGKSSNDLGTDRQSIATKYPEGFQV